MLKFLDPYTERKTIAGSAATIAVLLLSMFLASYIHWITGLTIVGIAVSIFLGALIGKALFIQINGISNIQKKNRLRRLQTYVVFAKNSGHIFHVGDWNSANQFTTGTFMPDLFVVNVREYRNLYPVQYKKAKKDRRI